MFVLHLYLHFCTDDMFSFVVLYKLFSAFILLNFCIVSGKLALLHE